VLLVSRQDVAEQLVEVSRDVRQRLLERVDSATVVLLIQHLDNKHHPHENAGSLFPEVVPDFLGQLATANLQFVIDVAGDVVVVTLLTLEHQF